MPKGTFIPLSELFKKKIEEPIEQVELLPEEKENYQPAIVEELKQQIIDDSGIDAKAPYQFITGPAGSGKTHTIRLRSLADRSYITLGATTGIAAINLDTKTINSIIKYFNTQSLEEHFHSGFLQHKLREIREETTALGIEEVSMMPARQLDIFFDAIHEINMDANPRKLGLHLIGDLCQLPPVRVAPENAELVVKANCWPFFKENTVKLTKIWRQDNPDFIKAINFVRAGNGNAAVPLLKSCGVQFVPKLIEPFDGTTIIPVNDGVDSYNARRLGELKGEMIRAVPERAGEQLGEWKSFIPNELRLKIGAYVMILSNDCPDFTYVNGDCGTIIGYDKEKDNFTIELKRNKREVIISRIKRKNLINDPQPKPHHFTPTFKPTVDLMTSKWSIGHVNYHPLRLAYASTVHKTQGLSLDKVQIDPSHWFFGQPGMAYVAISRAKTPEGLIIAGSEAGLIRKIQTSPQVRDYV